MDLRNGMHLSTCTVVNISQLICIENAKMIFEYTSYREVKFILIFQIILNFQASLALFFFVALLIFGEISFSYLVNMHMRYGCIIRHVAKY